MGGVAVIIEAVLGGPLGEGEVVVVDEELVATKASVEHVARVAYIDVEPSVGIQVDEYHAGAPLGFGAKAGFCRDVFEAKATLVAEEFVRPLVGGEEDLRKAIVVEVPSGDAPSVVEVAVLEDVERLGFGECVLELDTRVIHTGEEGVLRHLGAGRGEEQRGKGDATDGPHGAK
jgi:hypothetical protein